MYFCHQFRASGISDTSGISLLTEGGIVGAIKWQKIITEPGARGPRAAEYVTKMMNAFWLPFPRFLPRRYAKGAGVHYHKALICQTPEAVCESGVGISERSGGGLRQKESRLRC